MSVFKTFLIKLQVHTQFESHVRHFQRSLNLSYTSASCPPQGPTLLDCSVTGWVLGDLCYDFGINA